MLNLRSRTSRGAALVEYGILTGLIAVLSIGAVLALGNRVNETFTTVSDTLGSNMNPEVVVDEEIVVPESEMYGTATRALMAEQNAGIVGACESTCSPQFGSLTQIGGAPEVEIRAIFKPTPSLVELYIAGNHATDDLAELALSCERQSDNYTFVETLDSPTDFRYYEPTDITVIQTNSNQPFIAGETWDCAIEAA
jgi:pilus assembly protein Flp/PilA